MARSELEDAVGDELPVILVGRHHIDVELLLRSLRGDGADHVVGLVARDLEQGDVPGLDEAADVGYGCVDVLRRLLALGFVFGKGLVAEGGPGGVESDGGVGGRESSEGIVKRVDEAEDGRGVHAFRVDARIAYEGVVGTVDQCVSIDEEELHLGCMSLDLRA